MIRILTDKIEPDELKKLCAEYFISFVKIVVDIKKGIISAGGELHSDAEAILIEHGSTQRDIWGANFYPYKVPEERVEYTALINIKPRDDNPDMEIMNQKIRQRVKNLAETYLLEPDETLA